MRVKLVAGGGYVNEEKVLALMDLGFRMQKEFTRYPSMHKTWWVAVNSPECDIELEDLITTARKVGAHLKVDCTHATPVISLLGGV